MNVVLWIIAGLLAVAFALSGFMKLGQPKAKLASSGMGWVDDYSDGQVKTIGTLELLGAIGLVLPALLGIAEILTPLAAVGLALTMAGAAVVHAKRGEKQMIPINVVLGALALFVAVMRFGPNSF